MVVLTPRAEGSYSLEQCEDVHAAAGVFKLYLRELPDPLLTHRFYDTFIAVQSTWVVAGRAPSDNSSSLILSAQKMPIGIIV